jgi:hypothetical protein
VQLDAFISILRDFLLKTGNIRVWFYTRGGHMRDITHDDIHEVTLPTGEKILALKKKRT